MIEQGYKHEYGPPPADPGLPCLPPVEGRVDVAEDVEEEQRNAYSARAHEAQVPQEQGPEGVLNKPAGDFNESSPPPAEGRTDVARDIEEEQRDAYSTHRY